MLKICCSKGFGIDPVLTAFQKGQKKRTNSKKLNLSLIVGDEGLELNL
jgi:hypothetical protein